MEWGGYILAAHTVTGALAIIFNGVLLLLCVTKTPANMKVFAVLLANEAVVDLLASVCNMMVMCRVLTENGATVNVYYGLCTLLGAQACYASFLTLLHAYVHTVILFPLNFYYRLYVLKHGAPTIKAAVIICALVYLPSCLIWVFEMIFSAYDTRIDLLAANISLVEKYQNATITGHVHMYEFWTVLLEVYISIPCFPVYISVFIIRKKVLESLKYCALTEHTKRMHRDLIKVLSIQAILPIFYGISHTLYHLELFDVAHHDIIGVLITLLPACLPMINPFVTIYFVAPYRKAMLGRRLDRSCPLLQSGGRGAPRRLIARLKNHNDDDDFIF